MEDHIEESIPLTKPKRTKQIIQSIEEPIAEQPTEQPIQTIQPASKQKRKITKPKSLAQLQAFEKARLKRQENADARRKEKELHYAKLLREEEQKQLPEPEDIPVKKKAPKKQIIYQEESDSEPEVVYVKKPSKKKKTRVIVESSSESESSEDEPVSIQRSTVFQTFNPNDYFA